MAESKSQLSAKAQELTDRVRQSRFGKDVLGPRVAQPLAQWLDSNFGEADENGAEDTWADEHAGAESSVKRLNGTAGASVADESGALKPLGDVAAEVQTELTSVASVPDVAEVAPAASKGVLGLLKALGQRVKEHNLVVVAAGIAFWGLLAIPATLFAVISIAGLVLDPATVKDQVSENLSGLPEEAQTIIGDQLEGVSGGSTGGLVTGLVVGLLLALWTASGAMAKMMGALNMIYGTSETRKFPKLRGTALGLTLGGIVFISSAIFLLAALPALLGSVDGVGGSLATLFNWLRFPVLGLVMVIALGVLYHVGPDRPGKYRPLTIGAVVAMVLWIALSGLFSVYTSTVGSYNETYGSIGGIVILLLWLFITAFVVLLGAEIHAEREGSKA